MITVLYAGAEKYWSTYNALIPVALKARGIEANFTRSAAPDQVDYMVFAPNGPVKDFGPFTRLKAVLSLWAGVERVVGNTTLRAPLCRMVDVGLQTGMAEWVAGHCLRYHLGMDAHIINPAHRWQPAAPPLAQERRIGILGLGALGQACAKALNGLGFEVLGWSRKPKEIPEVACFAGEFGLEMILPRAEILVLMLPETRETTNIINAKTLALMPKGAYILNPGRGPLIEDDALLAALNNGHIAHVTLDVFRTEPLPEDHPYWSHPKVTVTPHIAAETRPKSAAEVIAENISRGEAGRPYIYVVNRNIGY